MVWPVLLRANKSDTMTATPMATLLANTRECPLVNVRINAIGQYFQDY